MSELKLGKRAVTRQSSIRRQLGGDEIPVDEVVHKSLHVVRTEVLVVYILHEFNDQIILNKESIKLLPR